MTNDNSPLLMTETVDIVTAYVAKNSLPAADVPALIASVHAALVGLQSGAVPAGTTASPVAEKPSPAAIKKSITPDALISFIDGKPYKTLKRHLTKHGLDLAAYRERYGLPADYPSVAASYSEQRSALAKSLGLGSSTSKTRPAKAA